MTLEQKTADSLAELAELSGCACRDALASGAAVDLVVGNTGSCDARKLELRTRPGLSAGVHVQTYDEWVEGMWSLFGDGRRLVTALQRRVLLRPLVAESGLLGAAPSAKFMDELAGFVADAAGSPSLFSHLTPVSRRPSSKSSSEGEGGASTAVASSMGEEAPVDASGAASTPSSEDETLRRLEALVAAYVHALEEHGLVEQSQAEALLVQALAEHAAASGHAGAAGAAPAAHAVVLEGVDLANAHRRAFVDALADHLPVTRIEQSLAVAGSIPSDQPPDANLQETAVSCEKIDVGSSSSGVNPQETAVSWQKTRIDPVPSSPAAASPDLAGELDLLRAQLYTGNGGLPATGALLVGEARGAHAADAVTCALVRRMLDAGARPEQVAVVLPNVAESYPHAQLALARAGIPFVARFSVPAARTPFGSAFCELMRVKAAPGSDDSHAPLADFVATPYAGIAGRDARALQMRWRERAGSTPVERLADIAEGFAQGNATATKTRERLAPLAELLDPALDPAACVRLMFSRVRAHAQAAASKSDNPAAEDALADDRAAAQSLLGYLDACAQLGCDPLPDELASCTVALERGYAPALQPLDTNPQETAVSRQKSDVDGGALGCAATAAGAAPDASAPSPADAVLLTDVANLASAAGRRLVVPDLDARHYPMARQPGPFDSTRERLGIAEPDDTTFRQRILLQNLIELATATTGQLLDASLQETAVTCEKINAGPSSSDASLLETGVSWQKSPGNPAVAPAPASVPRIAFARATHDADAGELVQSALWDELMTAYRTSADDAADLPIQGIPAALAPHAVRISEAELFARAADPAHLAGVRPVVRGLLASSDDVALLTHDLAGKEMPFSPTAIEDYYRCPYRWFACRRVGYNGMDAEFDAAAQGNLAHATMERFYRALQAQGQPRVTPENLPAALELLSRSLDEQVAHDQQRSRGGIFLRTERDRYEVEEIRSMLADLVRRDAVFLPGFAPAYFELTLGKGTGTMLEYGGVPVRGKVDRIDVDEQGNAVIIDYKLSGLSAGYGLNPKLDVPGRIQTDIYARLVQRHFDLLGVPLRVVGSVYRSYSRNNLRGAYARGIDWGPEESVQENKDALPREGHVEDYDAYLDLVEDTVAACMERLHEGHIEPEPLHGDAKSVCEYCKALPFCPRGEK